MSYGVAAQLAGEPALRAPILQLHERDRYQGLHMAASDVSRPGLIVDLPRRLSTAELSACFNAVAPLPDLARGAAFDGGTAYAVFVVSGPRRDIVREGC